MERVQVVVKPNSKKTEILELSPLKVAIAAPPKDNKANIELIKFLTKHYKRPVRIVMGLTSKRKLIEINQ